MKTDFAFLCLAKNCEETVPRFLALLDAVRAKGLQVTAIVGENGSRDGTERLLRLAESRGQLSLISTAFMAEEPDRLRRMGLGRERLKAELDAIGLDPRFVCVVDIDNVIREPPSVAVLLAAASKLDRKGIFGVSATSAPHYYDLLAFENSNLCFERLLDELAKRRWNIFAYYRFFKKRIYPHQRTLTSKDEIECSSAFNGLCIYRGDTYWLGSYLHGGSSMCEHLIFNRGVGRVTGAKMLIDPDLVVPTPGDHRQQMFLPFAWQRLKKFWASRILREPVRIVTRDVTVPYTS